MMKKHGILLSIAMVLLSFFFAVSPDIKTDATRYPIADFASFDEDEEDAEEMVYTGEDVFSHYKITTNKHHHTKVIRFRSRFFYLEPFVGQEAICCLFATDCLKYEHYNAHVYKQCAFHFKLRGPPAATV